MDVESYMAMGGVAARNALSRETDVEVLSALCLRETRQIVRSKAERRLRSLGGAQAAVEEAAPEATPAALPLFGRAAGTVIYNEPEPVVEPTPEPESTPEPEAAGDFLSLPDGPAVTRTSVATSRLDDLLRAGVKMWACKVCGVERPIEDCGKRNVGGVIYMQPRCGKCRNKTGLTQRRGA